MDFQHKCLVVSYDLTSSAGLLKDTMRDYQDEVQEVLETELGEPGRAWASLKGLLDAWKPKGTGADKVAFKNACRQQKGGASQCLLSCSAPKLFHRAGTHQ